MYNRLRLITLNSWANKLDEYFPASGLTLVMEPPILKSALGPEYWTLWMQMSLMTLDEMVGRSAASMSEEQLDDLISQSLEMKREAQRGVAFLVDLVVVVGRLAGR